MQNTKKRISFRTIKGRTFTLLSVILMALLGLNIMSLVQSAGVDNQITIVKEANLPLFQSMGNIQVLQVEQETIALQMIASATMNQDSDRPDRSKELMSDYDSIVDPIDVEYNNAISAAQMGLNTSELPDDIDEYAEVLDHVKSLQEQHIHLNNEISQAFTVDLSLADMKGINQGMTLIQNDSAALKADIKSLVDHVNLMTEHNTGLIQDLTTTSRNVSFIFITIIFIFVIATMVMINLFILKPLKNFRNTMEEISTGDFTVTIPEKTLERPDEIGELAGSLKQLKDNVANLLDLVVRSAGSVAESATGLAEVSEQSSMAMNEITIAMMQISEMTDAIYKAASDAEQITALIEAISSQTNLLALNASIEAARAGEAGKGFAVVAEEIPKLSEETSSATDDIKELIGDIQKRSSDAVDKMTEIRGIFAEQNESIESTSGIFKETSASLQKLNEQIDQVREVSKSISENKDDIIRSIREISSSIEENTGSVEQASASTQEQMASIEELSSTAHVSKSLSDDLIEATSTFKI